jgi:hypothetical protein
MILMLFMVFILNNTVLLSLCLKILLIVQYYKSITSAKLMPPNSVILIWLNCQIQNGYC